MCLIIHKPAGHTFSKVELRDYEAHNPNGFGMMWHEDGNVQIMRTLNMSEVPYLIDMVADKEAVLHWRYTTHGNDSLENTHPFLVTPTLAMMHNGILPCAPEDKTKSDTWMFANEILPHYLNGSSTIDDNDVTVLDKWIGVGNRLVFMDGTGKVTIVGKAKGVEHKGCWYSNEYAWTAPNKYSWKASPSFRADRGDWSDPWGIDRPSDFQTEEIIVLDEISPEHSRDIEAFKADISGIGVDLDSYQEIAGLIDWYCGRTKHDFETLATLLWNVVREAKGA